jgi:hypothetical protein
MNVVITALKAADPQSQEAQARIRALEAGLPAAGKTGPSGKAVAGVTSLIARMLYA